MADISKITLPSGNTYEIKDAVARQLVGVSFVIAWDGTAAPVVANIPAGVKVTYNSIEYTGTLDADETDKGTFYLVKSSSIPSSETLDIYDEYIPVGTDGSKFWEKIGDTQVNLTDVVTGVSLTKATDVVLGEDTTFALSSGTVSVTPSTTYLKTTSSGGGTDTFIKSVTAETNKKMVTTTVPNVTSAGSASTWSFTMGSGDAAETLIIGGGNGSAPTLGTAITAATGATATDGTGAAVVTGVTVGDSATAYTSLPTIALDTDSSSGTGKVQVATGVSSASVGTTITVGTNDKVTAVKDSGTSISVTKGNA